MKMNLLIDTDCIVLASELSIKGRCSYVKVYEDKTPEFYNLLLSVMHQFNAFGSQADREVLAALKAEKDNDELRAS